MTNHPFFPSISLPTLPHISSKTKTRVHSTEVQKHDNTTVNQQKRTICVLKCWLNCQVASFEALLSHEAVPFLRLDVQKRHPVNMMYFVCFLVSHRTTCTVKECWRSRKGSFLATKKKARDAHPHFTHSHTHCQGPIHQVVFHLEVQVAFQVPSLSPACLA